MLQKVLILLILPFILIGCDPEEPNPNGLFRLQINSIDGDVDLALGIHSAEIGINGEGNNIVVELLGDFDSFNISDGIPEWMSVSTNGNQITIVISDNSGGTRIGKVSFTVFKGQSSESGNVTVTQSGQIKSGASAPLFIIYLFVSQEEFSR